jgi:probable phosphoglycerate mutase
VTIDAIYASPLERAMETARPLAADRNLAIETRIGLGETMTGEWIGRSVEELKQTDEWKSFLAHPGRVRIPGGETAAEVQARMVAEIESIRQAHPKGIVAVVSHADPIKITVAHYLGLDLDYLNRLVVSPASVTMLRLGDHGARLLRLNDTGTIPTVSGEALR